MKVAFEDEKEKVKKRLTEVEDERNGIGQFKKKMQDENLAL